MKAIYEAFGRGDVPAILDVIADGCEWEARSDNSAVKADVRDEEMHLWTFNAAGEVVRLRHYTDTAKHIAAHSG